MTPTQQDLSDKLTNLQRLNVFAEIMNLVRKHGDNCVNFENHASDDHHNALTENFENIE